MLSIKYWTNASEMEKLNIICHGRWVPNPIIYSLFIAVFSSGFLKFLLHLDERPKLVVINPKRLTLLADQNKT